MLYCKLETPVGYMLIAQKGDSLAAAKFARDIPDVPQGDSALLQEARRQITQYFHGNRRAFDLPLHMEGTPFQLAIWRALLGIPYGETRSYADIARQIGHPKAYRAVGAANHANPLCVLVPCHRVIASSGRLCGYAGGVDVKGKLLAMERAAVGNGSLNTDFAKV